VSQWKFGFQTTYYSSFVSARVAFDLLRKLGPEVPGEFSDSCGRVLRPFLGVGDGMNLGATWAQNRAPVPRNFAHFMSWRPEGQPIQRDLGQWIWWALGSKPIAHPKPSNLKTKSLLIQVCSHRRRNFVQSLHIRIRAQKPIRLPSESHSD
jgi:hypothetical protein